MSDQGSLFTCTIHAIAKAFCDGYDRGMWTQGRQFDADQSSVITTIMALLPKPGPFWPSDLDRKSFHLKDKNCQLMGEFKLKIDFWVPVMSNFTSWFDDKS